MNSRTNTDAPIHHGGVPAMLWASFGPLQLRKAIDKFLIKIEKGGFEDFPTHPMSDRKEVDPNTFSCALRVKEKSNRNSGKDSNDEKGPMSHGGIFCCQSTSAVA